MTNESLVIPLSSLSTFGGDQISEIGLIFEDCTGLVVDACIAGTEFGVVVTVEDGRA